MKKSVGNLQHLYDTNQIFYHCNACGDINVPGKPPMYCKTRGCRRRWKGCCCADAG